MGPDNPLPQGEVGIFGLWPNVGYPTDASIALLYISLT